MLHTLEINLISTNTHVTLQWHKRSIVPPWLWPSILYNCIPIDSYNYNIGTLRDLSCSHWFYMLHTLEINLITTNNHITLQWHMEINYPNFTQTLASSPGSPISSTFHKVEKIGEPGGEATQTYSQIATGAYIWLPHWYLKRFITHWLTLHATHSRNQLITTNAHVTIPILKINHPSSTLIQHTIAIIIMPIHRLP